MRIGKRIVVIVLAVLCGLTGCGFGKKLPNTYVEGSDHQYMRMGISFFPYFQKGEKGYYFKMNQFLYFLDDVNEKIVPLCNRADCLHDKETDDVKRQKCNAYLLNSDDSGIAYCNGSLYYLDPGMIPGSSERILYRIHADGSGKEELYRWKENGQAIQQWIVHRDVLYYMTQTYFAEKEDVKQLYAAYAMSLTGDAKLTPRQIYQSPQGVEVATLGNPTAYGNYMYFSCLGNLDGWDGSDDNWMDYKYYKTFVYDIQTEELSEFCPLGEDSKSTMTQINTFWDGRVLFRVSDFNKKYLTESTVYIANLDGTEPEEFTTTKKGYSFYGDEAYLYQSNVNLRGRGLDTSPACYRVYDGDLNEVDTFTVGDEQQFEFPIGLPDRAYNLYIYEKTGAFGVEYWDKSEIGSLHGAEIKWTEIPYTDSAAE